MPGASALLCDVRGVSYGACYSRLFAVSQSVAMTSDAFWSFTLSELRLTKSSCVSAALTSSRIAWASASTFDETIAVMLSGKKRPSGSSRATRSFVLMLGSAV